MTRRRFLRGAVAASAGTAALAVPALARAVGPIVFRCQSAWGEQSPFHETALALSRRLGAMTGGDLKMEVLPAGSVAPAAGLLDSVTRGSVDCGHCMLAHHYHKHSAFGLWGSGPAFGMSGNELLAWHRYGGGRELLEKLHAAVGANVVSYLYGPMPAEPLGWFKKPVARPKDLKGLRYRATGMAAELFSAMGADVQQMPAEEIVAALERGALDGAAHGNLTADRALGLAEVAKVCMLQSYHETAGQLELLFNRDKLEALPAKLRAVIEGAVEAASQEMLWKAFDRHSRNYEEMAVKEKVRFAATPPAVLQSQLEAFDAVARKRSENALFREIQESQKQFARRVVGWELASSVDRRAAYRHYFAKPASARRRKK